MKTKQNRNLHFIPLLPWLPQFLFLFTAKHLEILSHYFHHFFNLSFLSPLQCLSQRTSALLNPLGASLLLDLPQHSARVAVLSYDFLWFLCPRWVSTAAASHVFIGFSRLGSPGPCSRPPPSSYSLRWPHPVPRLCLTCSSRALALLSLRTLTGLGSPRFSVFAALPQDPPVASSFL